MRMIPTALPAGAVRRYGVPGVPIPSERPTSLARGKARLVHTTSWIAGYLDQRMIGVIRGSELVAELVPNGDVVFSYRDVDGTPLVRWSLTTGVLEPLALFERGLVKLGTDNDATRIAALAEDDVRMYDGNGALRWECADAELGKHGRADEIYVNGDEVAIHFCVVDDDDHDGSYSVARATAGGVTWQHSTSRPEWFHPSVARTEYGVRALGKVAVSHDGTRVATARAAWTRPEGVALAVPEIYDGGLSSSWGGEADVHSLAFDATGELLRVSSRNAYRDLARCLAGSSTSPSDYTMPLPWTERFVTRREDGAIALGDRHLITARDGQLQCASDGSAIAVVHGAWNERRISLFDAGGEPLHEAAVPSGGVMGIGPGGTRVALHHTNGFMVVKLPDGESETLVLADTAPAFSPDGRSLAYGRDWRLCVMDLATRAIIRTGELTSPVTGACYGRDGALFTELADGTVIEWSLRV